jgi:hypothetical protein
MTPEGHGGGNQSLSRRAIRAAIGTLCSGRRREARGVGIRVLRALHGRASMHVPLVLASFGLAFARPHSRQQEMLYESKRS